MTARCPKHIVCAAALLAFCFASAVRAADDPLPSWNDGPAKQQIVDFVNSDNRQRESHVRATRGAHCHL
jgi:hypothetical protein